ncbi:hypothetical protein O0I10_005189 [Lichtheimia ornata]|uniref:Spindle pole body component n=1 Tax=Lichtheimia ornata TaxID=688661 RepID=A0AAD7XYI0_9FUNG|nr:uncharacterized protein O0I10_005189 [Lichtheimia ornata]KAJ8659150.1 hypothetical protein O0I10_005189 [Lichtheimia ornata]
MDNRQQLVESVFGRKVDPALVARLQPALTGLDRHRFTSTDEFAVRRRWEGLCEKFSIHGYGEAATRLRSLKDKFMNDAHSIGDSCTSVSSQHALKYDMLALLLALSSGSPSQPLDNETSSAMDTVQESGADFWRRTLLEEPLEGDHWQQYQSDDEDEDMMSMDGTEEDLELDQEELARFKARSTTQQEPLRSISPTDERWYSTYMPIIEHDQEEIARNQDHVRRYWEDPEELTEADIMREVVFMLRGLPSILFEKTTLHDEETRTIRMQVASTPFPLSHLSNTAVKSILKEFNEYGNIMNNLREWLQRVLSNSKTDDRRYGQTCEAFAVCVAKMFQAFERRMSSIEVDYCQTQGGKSIISILKLKNTLDPSLKAFQVIYEVTTRLHDSDSPRALSQKLLSTIYMRICEAETQGKQDVYNVLVYLYHETIKPFAQLLDDWTTRATLKGDVAQEFFISRSDRRDSELVEDEFYVHEPRDDDDVSGYPLFNHTFMDKVFFVGKAIEIISRFRDEMERIPTYIDCFDKVIPTPKTVFDSSDNSTPSKPFQPTLSQQTRFLQAGFPLLKNGTQHLTHTSSSTDTTVTPYLFDQAILQSLDDYIAEPYLHATQKLRVVLYESCSLISHLRRIASIYLMLEDELMHIFCETLFQKMDKGIYPENSSTNTQIDKLFMDAKSAIGGLHQDLTLSECSFDHNASGSFLDKIRFSYHLPWPINNYIRRSSLRKYSSITTLLLRLKRTKHLLDRKTLTQQKRSMRMVSMRVRLIWFVNSFSSYVMTTVLHTETMALRHTISRLENMDDMVQLHADYVDRIVDRCLLGDKTRSIHAAILRVLDQVQDLAQMFIQPDVETSPQFTETMENMEKRFVRDNEFISTSLAIIGKKGNFPWFDALAATLSSHGNTAYS